MKISGQTRNKKQRQRIAKAIKEARQVKDIDSIIILKLTANNYKKIKAV